MNEDAPKYKSRILQFFSSHPLLGFLGFLGSIASIIALVLSIFPWLSSPKRELCYCINPVRTPFVQTTNLSAVSVYYKGVRVNGNVTAAHIAIWNAGREPIRREDILSPITLLVGGEASWHYWTKRDHTGGLHGSNMGPDWVTEPTILEVTFLKPSRSECEFKADNTNDEMTFEGLLGLDWKILEHNDGALIQIVYAGTQYMPIELEGTIIGQKSPRRLRSIEQAIAFDAIIGMIAGSLIAGLLAGALGSIRRQSLTLKILRFAVLLIGLVWAVFSAVTFWHSQIKTTPFGF
jgi:hypothetical protein